MKKICLAWVMIGVLLSGGQAQAASLNVMSVDGTSSLRLGRVLSGLDNKKELRVRISTTDGKRYQVFQRVVEPIVNEKGESLDLKAVELASVAGSNASGTLYLQNVDHLNLGEQLIYTSGKGGESDSFEIAYALRPDLLNVSGSFAGKIVFTLRQIDGGEQQESFINVFLENAVDFKALAVGGRVPGRVAVNDTGAVLSGDDVVKISFSGNMGREVRVYQETEFLPQNELAQEVGDGVVRFYAEGDDIAALREREPVPLKKDKVLLYAGQKSEDSFQVYFGIDKELAKLQEAGIYTTRVKYSVEVGDQSQVFPVTLECSIQPVFEMSLEFPPEGVSFASVLPNTPPTEKEVQVTVRSNMHKPYQVMQQLATPMRNAKGNEMVKDYFTMKVDVPELQKGQARFPEFVAVNTGDYPVFVSDAAGSPAVFRVVYKIQGYDQLPPGSYRAPVKFSLNQN